MKTILITGANRGIGLEMVKQYAQLNCTLLACCRNPGKAEELQHLSEKNNKIKIYQLDVNDMNHISQLTQQLKNETIDILINNSAVAGDALGFGNIQYEDFLNTLKINTVAPILLTQALLEQISRSKDKLIVNISSLLGSIQAHQDTSWNWPAYRVSKSALNSVTKYMANHLREKGIKVISLSPGWVKTDMGGMNADLTPEESVRGMINVLNKISLDESGLFLSYEGKTLPW